MSNHQGPTESVLRRIEGFARDHQESGFEAGYIEAYTKVRKSLARRALAYLLVGILLGSAISSLWFVQFNHAQGEPPADPLSYGNERGTQFTKAAEFASYFTVHIACSKKKTDYFFRVVRTSSSTGSGFFYDDKGHIVTNFHVVEGASEISIIWQGKAYPARFVGAAPNYDVAVLKASIPDAPSAKMLEPDQRVALAEQVLAIGSPFGLDQTVTQGIISHVSRRTDRLDVPCIQTDSPINPGNSGGPLVNLEGSVVGMNTMIVTKTGEYAGLGLAVPVHYVRQAAERIINEHGSDEAVAPEGSQPESIDQAILGVRVSQVILNNGVPGLRVEEIFENSPAAEAGLRSGDILVSLRSEDGPSNARDYQIGSIDNLISLLRGTFRPNERIRVSFYRNGEKNSRRVMLK